jgi:hypothetical protein
MGCAMPTPDAQRILPGKTQSSIGKRLNSLRSETARRKSIFSAAGVATSAPTIVAGRCIYCKQILT